jgi:ankyrin repeat protein
MIRRVSILSLLAGTLITAFPQAPALPSGAEALHSAVRSDNVAEAQRLIDSGVSVNARDALGSTPLHDAAWAGDASMVQFLIDRGADVNARHMEMSTRAIWRRARHRCITQF